MVYQLMNHHIHRGQRLDQKNHQGFSFHLGVDENSVQGVRGVALMSAIDWKWKSQALSAALLSFVESVSHGDAGSESGGFGVTLNIVKLLVGKKEPSPRYQTRGGDHTRVGRPVTRTRRSRGSPTHGHHKAEPEKGL